MESRGVSLSKSLPWIRYWGKRKIKIRKLSLVIWTEQTFGRFLFLHGDTRSVNFGHPNSAGNDDLFVDDNGIDFNVKPARLLAFVPFTPLPPYPPAHHCWKQLPMQIASKRCSKFYAYICCVVRQIFVIVTGLPRRRI